MFFITFRLFGSVPIEVLEKISDENKQLKESIIKESETHVNGKENYFSLLDEYLDSKSNGPYWLSEPDIAQMVFDSILYRDYKDYKLVCFCIMSNHVHLVIYKLTKPLHIVMQQLKSFTGREANKIIGRRSNALPDSQKVLRDSGKRSDAVLTSQQALRDPDTLSNASLNLQQAQQDTGMRSATSQNRKNKPFWQAESFDRLVRDRNDMAIKIKYTLNNPVKAGLIKHWTDWKYSYCRPEFIQE